MTSNSRAPASAPEAKCLMRRRPFVNNFFRSVTILASAMIATSPARAATPGPDEAEIREVAMRQGETWSRHDAKAYAALLTEDCDVVNVVGWWWKGRAELERKLTAAFRFVFQESTLSIGEVEVRFLSPEIALAHVRWTMVGARTPTGIPEPREGIQTLVLTKRTGHWLISGFQNTHSLPEQPFPAGPGAPPAATP